MRALNQPESWWGWHGYSHPEALSIVQILSSGTMTPRVAAMLWLAMERGRSLVLAADPPGAGKTTILTALLAFTHPAASVYFTRGWGETFRMPPRRDGDQTFILINEISDHLPVYSWGPYVQRAFELASEGYALASTMHADTVDGVIEQLVEECDVPERHIGHLAFIVPLFVGTGLDGRRVRRVREVAVLEPLGDRYDRCTVACWRPDDDTCEALATPAQINAVARRLGTTDKDFLQALGEREAFLAQLVAEGAMDIDTVQRRVYRFAGFTVVD